MENIYKNSITKQYRIKTKTRENSIEYIVLKKKKEIHTMGSQRR